MAKIKRASERLANVREGVRVDIVPRFMMASLLAVRLC
jgi:hypothetical protein